MFFPHKYNSLTTLAELLMMYKDLQMKAEGAESGFYRAGLHVRRWEEIKILPLFPQTQSYMIAI